MATQEQSTDGLADLSVLWNADETPGDSERDAVDPARRRRRRRRGLLITVLVLTVVFGGSGGYVAWALNAPVPDPVASLSPPPQADVPAPAAIVLPSQGAAAVSIAGADEYLGAAASGIWASSGTDEPRPIASISKLITALVVLDARPLASADDPGPTITFDKAAHDLYDAYYVRGATIAAMPTGSSMSEHDALAMLLIPSASNYAEAVSTWAFGSQGAFVNAARRWLAANGLAGTTIVEPTGMSPRNTSTPADLIALGKIAAANPVVAHLAGLSSLSLPGPGTVLNTNNLLGVDGVTGLKTGNLGENNYNLLYTATLDVGGAKPLSVTGVVLGGATHQAVNDSVRTLFASIRDGFHRVPLPADGTELGRTRLPGVRRHRWSSAGPGRSSPGRTPRSPQRWMREPL
jgi:D-alanyl-D-alanine carboxypeptidase (penicillin-binding protein 5/6)